MRDEPTSPLAAGLVEGTETASYREDALMDSDPEDDPPKPDEAAPTPEASTEALPALTFGEILRRVLDSEPAQEERDRLVAHLLAATRGLEATLDHSVQAATAIITAAEEFAHARALAGRDWAPWRERAGISAEEARRLHEFYRLALTPEDVVRLGGVTGVLAWAAQVRLPERGEVLRITLPLPQRPDSEAGGEVTAFVWWAAKGLCVGLLDPAGDEGSGIVTREPLPHEWEREVWATAWRFLVRHLADLQFTLHSEEDETTPPLLEALDRHRAAVLRLHPAHLH